MFPYSSAPPKASPPQPRVCSLGVHCGSARVGGIVGGSGRQYPRPAEYHQSVFVGGGGGGGCGRKCTSRGRRWTASNGLFSCWRGREAKDLDCELLLGDLLPFWCSWRPATAGGSGQAPRHCEGALCDAPLALGGSDDSDADKAGSVGGTRSSTLETPLSLSSEEGDGDASRQSSSEERDTENVTRGFGATSSLRAIFATLPSLHVAVCFFDFFF